MWPFVAMTYLRVSVGRYHQNGGEVFYDGQIIEHVVVVYHLGHENRKDKHFTEASPKNLLDKARCPHL